jgi:diguanylate cyclase (GGDEF)-like protein
MLFLDLNEFKYINDRLGHLAGDELLRRVGERLQKCVRTEDMVGRLGGDEFGILITGPLAASRIADVEDRIRTAIEFPFTIAGCTFSMSISIGAADGLSTRGSPTELWEAADQAMYRNKRKRRPPSA